MEVSPLAGNATISPSSHGDLLGRWRAAVFYESVHGRLAPETARTYASAIRNWSRYLAEQNLNAPSSVEVYAWLGGLRQAGRSPATCNKILCALRSCYAWLAVNSLYPDVARGLRPFRVHRDGALPAFSRDDVERLLQADVPSVIQRLIPEHAAIAHIRDQALLRVMYATGMRVVSLVRMDVDDVQPGDRTVLRHQSKGRDRKSEVAILPANASRVLSNYLSLRIAAGLNQSPLWIGLWPKVGTRLTSKSIRSLVTHRADLIGLRPRGADGRLQWPGVYGPHALRRSACVAVVDQFGIEAGQTLLGHSSSEQTRRSYARVDKLRVLNRVADSLDLGS